ncbi:uncharacterized protein LOC134789249 [Penaeus indicus]|uniref:uncharacterized protein LOC134789249 n=1 Tax=Penaeus indicus TaxID=29960 RepID=UPI00300CF791
MPGKGQHRQIPASFRSQRPPNWPPDMGQRDLSPQHTSAPSSSARRAHQRPGARHNHRRKRRPAHGSSPTSAAPCLRGPPSPTSSRPPDPATTPQVCAPAHQPQQQSIVGGPVLPVPRVEVVPTQITGTSARQIGRFGQRPGCGCAQRPDRLPKPRRQRGIVGPVCQNRGARINVTSAKSSVSWKISP